MNTHTAGEMLISELVGFVSELVPIDVEKTKNKLSALISKYHIKRVEVMKSILIFMKKFLCFYHQRN